MDTIWNALPYTLEEIATAAGCSASMLRKIRAGKRFASRKLANKISDAVGGKLKVEWLTGIKPYPEGRHVKR